MLFTWLELLEALGIVSKIIIKSVDSKDQKDYVSWEKSEKITKITKNSAVVSVHRKGFLLEWRHRLHMWICLR